MLDVKLPPEISVDEETIKRLIEQATRELLPVPIDKFIIIEPPRKADVMESVVRELQSLKEKIPESSAYLDSSIQSVSGPRIFGQETGTYSNEGQAIGCAVGAAIGGAIGGAFGGPLGAISGAGVGCGIGGSMGRAIGERRKFVQQ